MLWIQYFSFFMIFRPLNIQNGPSGDRDISSSAQNKSPALPKRFWWDSATVFLVQGAITFKIPLISWNHHFRANGSYRNTCNKKISPHSTANREVKVYESFDQSEIGSETKKFWFGKGILGPWGAYFSTLWASQNPRPVRQTVVGVVPTHVITPAEIVRLSRPVFGSK